MNVSNQTDEHPGAIQEIEYSAGGKQIKSQLSREIISLQAEWTAAAPQDNVFLQFPYLQCVHEYAPPGMRFVYQVFYQAGQAIGVAYYQIRHFDAYQSIKLDTDAPLAWWQIPVQWIRGKIAKAISFETLIAGNLMLTGEHHAYFSSSVDSNLATDLILHGVDNVRSYLAAQNIKVPLLLIKDYYPGNELTHAKIKQHRIHPFSIQPNMVLNLPERWRQFSDYIEDLQSKYRVRLKRAFKKSADIEVRKLDDSDVEQLMPELFALYKQTVGNAGFNVVDLNPNYLIGIHQYLLEDYTIYGCFYEGKIIAFFTLIRNGEDLEAHFLGMDAEINKEHQLYLTNLFRIVETGILSGCKKIVFARTAIEIKSSIGAKPVKMTCYMKHQNKVINFFVPNIIRLLNPMEQWQMRHPFKYDS